jgi:hypothetical protein
MNAFGLRLEVGGTKLTDNLTPLSYAPLFICLKPQASNLTLFIFALNPKPHAPRFISRHLTPKLVVICDQL